MVKSVRVTDEVHLKLQSIMQSYSIKTLGGAINYAINQLFLTEEEKGKDDSSLINNLKKQIKVYKEMVEFYQKLELERAKHPIQIITSNSSTSNTPIPSTPKLKVPPRPPIKYKNTGNIKKDYQTEIKKVFSGDTLKPSDILNITQPKHKNSDIKQLDEDAEIPEPNWLGEKIQKEMENLRNNLNKT